MKSTKTYLKKKIITEIKKKRSKTLQITIIIHSEMSVGRTMVSLHPLIFGTL